MSLPALPFTKGQEYEFYVYTRHPQTGALRLLEDGKITRAIITDLKTELGEEYAPFIDHELWVFMVEVSTPVATSWRQLMRHQQLLAQALAKVCAAYGCVAIPSSTPITTLPQPLENYVTTQEVCGKPRYERLAQIVGPENIQKFVVAGTHTQIGGFNSLDDVVRTLRPGFNLCPLVMGLTLSSSILSGSPQTGNVANRWTCYNALPPEQTQLPDDATPLSSLSDLFSFAAPFATAYNKLFPGWFNNREESCGVIWWPLRANVRHCTGEMRIADITPYMLDNILAGVIYEAHTLYCLENPGYTMMPRDLVTVNLHLVEQLGQQARIHDPVTRQMLPFTEVMNGMLHMLEKQLDMLGTSAFAHDQWVRIRQRQTAADRLLTIWNAHCTDDQCSTEAGATPARLDAEQACLNWLHGKFSSQMADDSLAARLPD